MVVVVGKSWLQKKGLGGKKEFIGSGQTRLCRFPKTRWAPYLPIQTFDRADISICRLLHIRQYRSTSHHCQKDFPNLPHEVTCEPYICFGFVTRSTDDNNVYRWWVPNKCELVCMSWFVLHNCISDPDRWTELRNNKFQHTRRAPIGAKYSRTFLDLNFCLPKVSQTYFNYLPSSPN